MKTNAGIILTTGGWYGKKDCPDSPRAVKHHWFKDVSSRPSGRKGEHLVTSECQHCGGIIKDCPTLYV